MGDSGPWTWSSDCFTVSAPSGGGPLEALALGAGEVFFFWRPNNQKMLRYGDSFHPIRPWKRGYSTPKRQPGCPRRLRAAWTIAFCPRVCKNCIKIANWSDFPAKQTKGAMFIKAATDPPWLPSPSSLPS